MMASVERVPGELFIVSSPSGGGKTTLIRKLLEDPPGDALAFSVSYTTRPPRPGEHEGREYHFVSPARFREMVALGEFLEHNVVHDQLYGTARAEVVPRLASGIDVVLDIDVNGARDILGVYPEAVSIFVVPPSRQELERRLRDRGLNDSRDIEIRLVNAVREIGEAAKVSERGGYLFQYVIVNADLNMAVDELKSIVRTRRLATPRQAPRLAELLNQFR
jgi:guanylate kinase